MLRIDCASSWLYLQDYTVMHGQQNIKIKKLLHTLYTNPHIT